MNYNHNFQYMGVGPNMISPVFIKKDKKEIQEITYSRSSMIVSTFIAIGFIICFFWWIDATFHAPPIGTMV